MPAWRTIRQAGPNTTAILAGIRATTFSSSRRARRRTRDRQRPAYKFSTPRSRAQARRHGRLHRRTFPTLPRRQPRREKGFFRFWGAVSPEPQFRVDSGHVEFGAVTRSTSAPPLTMFSRPGRGCRIRPALQNWSQGRSSCLCPVVGRGELELRPRGANQRARRSCDKFSLADLSPGELLCSSR